MLKLLFSLIFGYCSLFASTESSLNIDLTMTWVGILCLVIFVVGYYFVAKEEKYLIDKSKPALFMGTFMFILISIYYSMNNLDSNLLHNEANHLILEISGIFFFLFVAMIYIESLLFMGVFDKLKYNLVSKGYTYRKLFWVTGFLAFFISPIADNLTTALILSTVLITIDKNRKDFLVPSAINVVVAANAGGAWSPFGDITTLMAWTSGKGVFSDFLFLFPASIGGYLVTAFLLSKFVPNTKPEFDVLKEKEPTMIKGAKTIMALGVFTIFCAVISHQVLHLPAMWGMMFGLALLKIYSYKLNKKHGKEYFNIFHLMSKIENNTLIFFFGILAAVGALHFLGWLSFAAQVYDPSVLGPTLSNICVGFLSAIVDNVPVTSIH